MPMQGRDINLYSAGTYGKEGQFRLEIRLNQHPLSHQETEQWFQQLVGHDLVYAPLPVFP